MRFSKETGIGFYGKQPPMDAEKDLIDQLKSWMAESGATQAQLGKVLGIAQPQVTRLMSGDRRIKLNEALVLQQMMNNEDFVDIMVQTGQLEHVDLTPMQVPVMWKAEAGLWRSIDPWIDQRDPSDFEMVDWVAPKSYTEGQIKGWIYALRVIGDSMNKVAPVNSILVCLDYASSGVEIVNGDMVVLERVEGSKHELSAKRYKRNAGRDEFWPESYSPEWQEPIHYDDDPEIDVRVKAKVLQIMMRP